MNPSCVHHEDIQSLYKGSFSATILPSLFQHAVLKNDLCLLREVLRYYAPSEQELCKLGQSASSDALKQICKIFGPLPDRLLFSLALSDGTYPGRLDRMINCFDVAHACMLLIRERLQCYLSPGRERREAVQRLLDAGKINEVPFAVCAVHAIRGDTKSMDDYLKDHPRQRQTMMCLAVFFSRKRLVKHMIKEASCEDVEEAFEMCIRTNQSKIFHLLFPCVNPVLFKHKFLLSALLLRRTAMSKKLIGFVKRESIISGIDVWHDKTAKRLREDFLAIESEVLRQKMKVTFSVQCKNETSLRKM